MKSLSVVSVMVVSMLAGGQVFAADTKSADERLGGYTMADESMLGRYGDVNDEWVQSAAVSVDPQPAKKSQTPKKSVGKLGGYTMEDGSMLGRYGDHNDE